jgi:diguanylate cyclase (GGDEF)-like protein
MRETKLRRILLALTLLLISATVSAGAADLQLDPRSGSSDAENASMFLRDPTGRLTLRDVIALHAAFRAAPSLVPDVRAWALAPSTLWFRLEPRSAVPGPWFLHASPAVDSAEMYYVARDGRVARTSFGTLVPYNRRQLPEYSNVLELPARATLEGALYLRVVTREDELGGYSIRPAAWEATTGHTLAENRLLPELVILGIIGGLALFNALLGLRLRERIYYWYAAATGCFTLLEFMTTGAAWRWLWPNASVLFDVVVYPAYLCYFALMLLFARDFLNLPSTQRALWRAMLVIFCFGALVDTTFMVAPNLFDRTNLTGFFDPICSGLLLGAVLSSGVIAWRRAYVGAAPYTIAYAGVLCGILIGTLGNGRLLPSNGWTNVAPALGVAWEALFLALALAERIRLLRGERDALEVEALVDALTGIPNRRALDRRLAYEWRRGVRGHTQLATIMIDVDLFKNYNDAHGHVAGDAALKLVASCIEASVRRTDDFVARYGGEEFVVLLPYCTPSDAVAIADTIRAAVQSLGIAHPENASGRLTVSAGVAVASPSDETASEAIVIAADRALYVAKRTGRNCVAESETLVA